MDLGVFRYVFIHDVDRWHGASDPDCESLRLGAREPESVFEESPERLEFVAHVPAISIDLAEAADQRGLQLEKSVGHVLGFVEAAADPFGVLIEEAVFSHGAA